MLIGARRRATIFALMMGAAALTPGSVAFAQQPAKPAAAADSEARLRFEEGIKLAESGDHEAARLKFNQAWGLLKSPAILFNLARAEQLSGHPTDALEHYRQFAKLPPDPKIADAQRQRANESVAELAKKVGQIDVEAPAGARVSIDGRPIDASYTDPVPVNPGRHIVEAVVEGKTRSITVESQAGMITKARLLDANLGSGAPPPNTDGSAANGSRSTGPGSNGTAAIEPPKDTGPGFWTTGRIAGAGVAGVGLVGIGLGVVFAINASNSEDYAAKIRNTFDEPRDSACSGARASANETNCGKLRTTIEDGRSAEDLRTVFLVGGAGLVVGGAILFLMSRPKAGAEPTRGGVRVIPIVSHQHTGVSVVGRF